MDVLMAMTPNGGDIVKKGNDLSLIFGFENMPMLAMFGGNFEQSTPSIRKPNEQLFDWWGNSLMKESPAMQFNSETQRVMHRVALNSFGRIQIEEAIKRDLDFMKPFAVISVKTEIIATNILNINIKIKKPDNLEEKEFIFIWDKSKDEITFGDYAPNVNPVEEESLQYKSQFYL